MKFSNEPISSLTSFIAFFFSVAGLFVLISMASKNASYWHLVGVIFFGAGAVLVSLISSIYHLIPKGTKSKEIFRRMDHSAIFFFIAASYTSAFLVPLRGNIGWVILTIVWIAAIIGITLKSINYPLKTRYPLQHTRSEKPFQNNVGFFFAIRWLRSDSSLLMTVCFWEFRCKLFLG